MGSASRLTVKVGPLRAQPSAASSASRSAPRGRGDCPGVSGTVRESLGTYGRRGDEGDEGDGDAEAESGESVLGVLGALSRSRVSTVSVRANCRSRARRWASGVPGLAAHAGFTAPTRCFLMPIAFTRTFPSSLRCSHSVCGTSGCDGGKGGGGGGVLVRRRAGTRARKERWRSRLTSHSAAVVRSSTKSSWPAATGRAPASFSAVNAAAANARASAVCDEIARLRICEPSALGTTLTHACFCCCCSFCCSSFCCCCWGTSGGGRARAWTTAGGTAAVRGAARPTRSRTSGR